MKKLNLADFCKAENTYAQLIQNLFLHISVKKMYLILMMDTAEKGGHLPIGYLPESV